MKPKKTNKKPKKSKPKKSKGLTNEMKAYICQEMASLNRSNVGASNEIGPQDQGPNVEEAGPSVKEEDPEIVELVQASEDQVEIEVAHVAEVPEVVQVRVAEGPEMPVVADLVGPVESPGTSQAVAEFANMSVGMPLPDSVNVVVAPTFSFEDSMDTDF